MVRSLLNYTTLLPTPPAATPITTGGGHLGLPHSPSPDEPTPLSLPLPPWHQPNAVRAALEATDYFDRLSALGHAVWGGYEQTTTLLLEVRACLCCLCAPLLAPVVALAFFPPPPDPSAPRTSFHTYIHTQAGADPTFVASPSRLSYSSTYNTTSTGGGGGKGLMRAPQEPPQGESLMELAKRKGHYALRWKLEVRNG